MTFMDFGRSGQGAEPGDPGVADSAGDDRHQLIADKTGVVLITFDHFAADQFPGDDLKQ